MGCARSLLARPSVDLSGPVGLQHFDMQRVIGEGGFGKVKAVTKKRENPPKWYAMKVLNKETIVDRRRVKEVFQERDLLTFLRHERICNLYYSFQDPKHLYLVMDIALGGDLRYQLNHNAGGLPFSEDRARIYVAQLVLALSYVHSRGILHRDLKPENVLMDSDGWVMLTDFGISRSLDEAGLCASGSGTAGYMGPEVFRPGHKHGIPYDWFALGITLHEFLTKRRPYRGETIIKAARLAHKAQKGSKEEREAHEMLRLSRSAFAEVDVSRPCLDFITRLLEVNPEERLGATSPHSIMDHPWFQASDAFNWERIRDGTHSVPFLPNTKKMNAEPDADIHAVFMGDDEERNLRTLTPEEQKLFDGYEYDHHLAKEDIEMPQRTFAEYTFEESMVKSPASVNVEHGASAMEGAVQTSSSSDSLTDGRPTTPITPRVDLSTAAPQVNGPGATLVHQLKDTGKALWRSLEAQTRELREQGFPWRVSFRATRQGGARGSSPLPEADGPDGGPEGAAARQA